MVSVLSEQALRRRLKRHLMKEQPDFLAVCTPEFEQLLEGEVARLPNVDGVKRIRGGVEFSGPLDTMYHANLRLRTAGRVLLRLGEHLAQSYPMLFDHARKIPWELHLGFNDQVKIRVAAKASRLRHHGNIADTIHAAMLRRLEPLGLEPDISDEAAVEIVVRMFRDRCTLSLNTSGEHLHRRGYRQSVTEAPIRETLAAGILMQIGWRNYDLIVDPACGSGTFLIEAAHLDEQIAPGEARAFAFEHLPYFQESKWARFRSEAALERRKCRTRLVGIDIEPSAIAAARDNARRAGVTECTRLIQGDARAFRFGDLVAEGQGAGRARALLVGNLPYGERLGTADDVSALYRDLNTNLSATCSGWDYAFLTTRPEWLKKAGFRPAGEFEFSNGGLRTTLVQGVIG